MAGKGTKQWRELAERFLVSDASVEQRCALNHVCKAGMFRWLGYFADSEPELFGGVSNIADRSKRRWVTNTKANMRASRALTAPDSPGFIELDRASLLESHAKQQPCNSPMTHRISQQPDARPFIRIRIGSVDIEVSPGSTYADVDTVLKVVCAL